jgi:hypothetical protein
MVILKTLMAQGTLGTLASRIMIGMPGHAVST